MCGANTLGPFLLLGKWVEGCVHIPRDQVIDSSSLFTGSQNQRQNCFPAKELGTAAMKYMLSLYLLGVILTLLSIFVRLMESLEGLLENPLPGSPWIVRGQLANTEPPKGLPDHPSRGVQ